MMFAGFKEQAVHLKYRHAASSSDSEESRKKLLQHADAQNTYYFGIVFFIVDVLIYDEIYLLWYVIFVC